MKNLTAKSNRDPILPQDLTKIDHNYRQATAEIIQIESVQKAVPLSEDSDT